jgi:hypothetical protein
MYSLVKSAEEKSSGWATMYPGDQHQAVPELGRPATAAAARR